MRPFLFLAPFLLFLAIPLRAQETFDATPSPPSKEDQKAFQKTLQEAQRGDSKSMGTLGLMYEKGLGTAQDLGKAFHWLSRGAKKGDDASENNLGFLYLKGLGVKEDDAEALKWFQKAADQGLASAQGNLGLVYGRGLGVKKDLVESHKWFSLALRHPNLSGAQVVDLRNDIEWLEKRMTGKQIEEAKKHASEWIASKETPETSNP